MNMLFQIKSVQLMEAMIADGGHGHRLILAHLQGDSHTELLICTRRTAAVKFQLNQPF